MPSVSRFRGMVEVFELRIEPGFRMRGELGVERMLDLQLLDHRLDDPVASVSRVEIVLDIAGA